MIRQKSTTTIVSAAGPPPSSPTSTPHPSDIFTFVPYACLQLCMPFTVQFLIHDEPTIEKKKGKSTAVLSSNSFLPLYYGDSMSTPNEVVIEVARGPGRISLKLRRVFHQLIMILELAAPYCPTLERLIIPKRRLFPGVLIKISHLLKISNICELFLDGSTSYDDNYYLLLEGLTNLRLLSLDRCNINDDVCVKLAAALHPPLPASMTLNILSLSTNNISDRGATALAQALRTNRSLYHLNLSGNAITDVGGCNLISVLGDFCLTTEESIGMRRRYLEYLKVRNKEYQNSYKELLGSAEATTIRKVRTNASRCSLRTAGSHTSRSNMGSPKRNVSPRNLKARAEALAKARVGPFTDIFDSEQSERRGTVRYCRGNRILKSLALAYTQVTIVFLNKLVQVLRAQSGGGGLVRVEISGAPLPATCLQLDEARSMLKLAQDNQIKLPTKRKGSP